jgi:DNA-binding transcriptional regulator YdaS (Cro superfamily)
MAKKRKIVENEGIKRAIEVAGSQSALARLCGKTQPAVFHWLRCKCPPEQALKIEALTGVKRELICPEIFKPNA